MHKREAKSTDPYLYICKLHRNDHDAGAKINVQTVKHDIEKYVK